MSPKIQTSACGDWLCMVSQFCLPDVKVVMAWTSCGDWLCMVSQFRLLDVKVAMAWMSLSTATLVDTTAAAAEEYTAAAEAKRGKDRGGT